MDGDVTPLEPRYYQSLETGMTVIEPLAKSRLACSRETLGALCLALVQNAFP